MIAYAQLGCVLSRKVLALYKGKIERIRGVAWGMRVSPSVANRVVESAKGKLLQFIADIYIYAYLMTGKLILTLLKCFLVQLTRW